LKTVKDTEIVGPVSVAKSRIDCEKEDVEGMVGPRRHFEEWEKGIKVYCERVFGRNLLRDF